jgi:hypothetical protein
MVVVDMLAAFGVRDVLFLEDLDEYVDHDYIRQMTAKYRLNVVRIPKGRALFFIVGDTPLLLSLPYISRKHMTPVPTNVDPWTSGRYTCIDDELRAPHGTIVDDEGDLFFLGFKVSDVTSGNCVTFIDKLPPEMADARKRLAEGLGTLFPFVGDVQGCAPLARWSDDDVWDYIETYKVPYSVRVYNNRKRLPYGNPCCYRCHDHREAGVVFCPKVQQYITNLAHFTHPTDLTLKALTRLGFITPTEEKHLARL